MKRLHAWFRKLWAWLRVRFSPGDLAERKFVRKKLSKELLEVLRNIRLSDQHRGSLEGNTPILGYPEAVKFTAFWPSDTPPGRWADLIVYLHTMNAWSAVRADALHRLDLATTAVSQQTVKLARNAEITVIPEIDDADVNPPSARVHWLEEWHHVDFRFRLRGDSKAPHAGQISFYVGPVLVATLDLTIGVGDRRAKPARPSATIEPYRNIFVSYSHKDRDIVDQLERAAVAIGDTYLRDTKILRSGEEWNEAILAHIDHADVFQLCWSEEAKRSNYVDEEWRHAHALARRHFIRPMYWKEPMPEPPEELESIHFRYVPFA